MDPPVRSTSAQVRASAEQIEEHVHAQKAVETPEEPLGDGGLGMSRIDMSGPFRPRCVVMHVMTSSELSPRH
jgi:hypothetical protein